MEIQSGKGSSIDVIINYNGNNSAFVNGGPVYIDPTSHPILQTTEGPIPASTTRIVAHELGHAIVGTRDDGSKRMNNVNLNENPIVTALDPPEPARIRY